MLFDIDGTLLHCGPRAHRLFAESLRAVFGCDDGVDSYDFSGRTDPQIVYDLMRAAGFADRDIAGRLAALEDTYLGRLDAELDRAEMRLLPGVEAVLAAMRGAGLTLGLLTGNWERGARIKLARFALNEHFPFGAFGSDGIVRDELPPIALGRAKARCGRPIRPNETLIIGDSVHDIACAQAHAIPVLAVATGRTPADRLAACRPDWLASDLSEAARLFAWET